MEFNIALVKGDGIGPEIVDSAVRVLETIGEKFGHKFNFTAYPAGGCAVDEFGVALPDKTVAGCKAADAVLFGAVGGPDWDGMPVDKRPEKALLGLRSALGLYTNLRPAKLYPALSADCPLRADIAAKGIDVVIVRELTGGIYFGQRGRRGGKYGLEAYDTECYSIMEIERIARVAFEIAKNRKGVVTSVDKSNVLETSRLWRETVHRIAKEEYPEVKVVDMLVDNAAMQLVRDPSQFDVILASNMFGDIISDEASQITGSIGLLPSASIGDGTFGLYEPIHGSAPDIAWQDKANPIAAIRSAAFMLRQSFSLHDEAETIELAVENVLENGWRTMDIAGAGEEAIGCKEMTDKIIAEI